MRCPVNPTVELVTISVDGVSIEQCGKCHGHWLEHGELAKLASRAENVEPAVRVTHDSNRLCPKDSSSLTEVEFPEHSGLRVDICPQCQGIWLDANELSQALTLLGRQAQPNATAIPTRPVIDLLTRLTGRQRS
jgi:Zn-finger nucleic acid-binding protein